MSLLTELTRAADPSLRPYAVAEPGDGDFGADVPDATRAFVLEAVREAYLMHYDQPRAFAAMDEDLLLLAGDSLYALGLERLAEAGDLAAVAELAELISSCAQAEAEGRREAVAGFWRGSARTLAQGQAGPPNR